MKSTNDRVRKTVIILFFISFSLLYYIQLFYFEITAVIGILLAATIASLIINSIWKTVVQILENKRKNQL
jgi:hypothetical protein